MGARTALAWTPPAGMAHQVALEWAAFYRRVRDLYGITPADYRALYLAQSGRCYICRKAKGVHPDDPRGTGGRRLGVDHNHVIGNYRRDAVRGLLCTGGDKTCNRIIGWLDHAALVRAARHLAESPAQQVFAAMNEGYEDAMIIGMLTR